MEEKKCYLTSKTKEKCTGCRACVEICPKKCITMELDEEKFYYPKIDKQKCINCKKCLNSCPVTNDIKVQDKIILEEVYGYRTNDKKNLLNSSSGGAFYDIVKSFCNNSKKYAIFGVKFDENFNVMHDYITNIKEIDIFKKSKYVQSNVGDSYSKVKEFLNKKYKVVFSGTPCQVAGLRKYLNKSYDNMLCIDIICHGVPSQDLFNMWLNNEQKKYNSKICNVNFREKVLKKEKYNSKNIKIVLENGTTIIENAKKNMYLKGFQNELFYRPSCYECKFASIERYSDITIADCWGIENVDSTLDVHEGYSCIVVHTKMGKQIMDDNKFGDLLKLDKEFVIKNNNQYSKPAKFNKNRRKFYNNLNEINFENKVKKCTQIPFYRKILSKIIPSSIKQKIKRMLRK